MFLPLLSLIFLNFQIRFLVNAQSTQSITGSSRTSAATAPSGACLAGSPVANNLTQCQRYSDTVNNCDKQGQGAPFRSCYCVQSAFDQIIQCQSEQRLCFGNDNLGSDALRAVDTWHSICDAQLTFSPTTLPLSSITVKPDPRCTGVIYRELASYTDAYTGCVARANSMTASVDVNIVRSSFSSCVCQTGILANAFTALYVLNKTCLAAPITTSLLAGYGCDNFSNFYSTMLSSESAYSRQLYTPASINATATRTTASSSSGMSATDLPPSLPRMTTASSTSRSGALQEIRGQSRWQFVGLAMCLGTLSIVWG